MMVAGAVTIVACTKDNPINNTQNAQPIQQTSSVKSNGEITIAELTEDGIKLLFDKQKVLTDIQREFKKTLGINCVMEDIQVSTKKADKEDVRIITITYFDFNEEQSVSMFGLVEKKPGGRLVINYGEVFGTCRSKNCGKECTPSFTYDKYGNINGMGCVGCQITGNQYGCSFVHAHTSMSNIVCKCLEANLK